jgi:hypothetical protein
MLSTSANKVQQRPYLGIAISILVLLLAVSVPLWRGIPTFSGKADLSTLSASDVSAYRWEAMAKFYSSQAAGIPFTGQNLTSLSAAEVSAYRWQGMAQFYRKLELSKVKYGPPGR